jgi:acyltransferase
MGEMDIKQRLTYIDIARAIGILFVVLGHVNQFYRDSQGIENSQTLCVSHATVFYSFRNLIFRKNIS